MRLFLAVGLPESVREHLAQVQVELRRPGDGVRWVRPAGIHLTLQFLGEVADARLGRLEHALRPLGARPSFSLRLGGVGAFPNWARPRVVWVGVEPAGSDLAGLRRDLLEVTGELGFQPDDRPFHPHLTLGRVSGAASGLAERVRAAAPPPSPTFPVTRLTLYQSLLRPNGAEYRARVEIPFQEAP